MIQSDHEFLQSFFSALNQSSLDPMNPSSIELTHDLVNFLKEFCLFSQTLQPQNRESFFKSLQSFGILTSLQSLIELDDEQVKLSVIEIILYFTMKLTILLSESLIDSLTKLLIFGEIFDLIMIFKIKSLKNFTKPQSNEHKHYK